MGVGAAPMYGSGNADVDMDNAIVGDTGGGQAHNNMQPFIGLRFIIALQGLYPSRS